MPGTVIVSSDARYSDRQQRSPNLQGFNEDMCAYTEIYVCNERNALQTKTNQDVCDHFV